MAEHLDLEGMSHNDAQRYVQQYIAALKEVQRKRAQLKAEFDKWESRARLAQEKGRHDLEEQAMAQCRDLAAQYESLGSEEQQLDTDVLVLKKNLNKLQRQAQRTVDAEALLEQLSNATGMDAEAAAEAERTNRAVSDLEIDDELERLKKQVSGTPDVGGNKESDAGNSDADKDADSSEDAGDSK